jgi:hypothetical protein
MATATYELSGYLAPLDHLNGGPYDANVSRSDIVRAIVTLASQRKSVLSQIRSTGMKWFVLQKIADYAQVYKHCQVNAGRLAIHPQFFRLPPSDKRETSRRLGEAFAKLYAERVLEVPRLAVLESLRGDSSASVSYASALGGQPKEPDMIGQNLKGDWHVVEAKGRSGTFSRESVFTHGKTQAKNLLTINGDPPVARTVVLTALAPDRIHSHLRDPTERGDATVRVEQERFDGFYYGLGYRSPELNARTRRTALESRDFEFLQLSSQIEVGFDLAVLDSIRSNEPLNTSSIEELAQFGRRTSDEYSIGPDGIAVHLTPAT